MIFILQGCSYVLLAQPLLNYAEQLTIADGLSSNSVTDMVQDQNGFLWIATENGLNRYDGAEVVQYYAGKDSTSLVDNSINRLIRWDTFHIAIATNQGLSILDTRDYTMRNRYFKFDSTWEFYDNQLLFMEKDSKGNLWIGTPVSIYCLDKNLRLKKVIRSTYTLDDIGKKRIHYVFKIIPLPAGKMMFCLSSGVQLWDPIMDTLIQVKNIPDSNWVFLASSSFYQISQAYNRYVIYFDYSKQEIMVTDEFTGIKTPFHFPLIKNKSISKASSLGDGWIALSFRSKGMALLRLQEKQGKLQISCNSQIYFPDKSVKKAIQDNEGNRWFIIGTEGLLKISPGKQLFSEKILLDSRTHQLSQYGIVSFFQLHDKIFIGTYGDGFYIWDRTTGKMKHLSAKYGANSENMVWDFSLHSKDTLWIGTQQGLLYYNTFNGNIGRLPQSHPLVLDSFAITTQFRDSKGLVWIGIGYGRGVCVYNEKENTFHVYPNSDRAYPYRYPYNIAEDKNSDLWFVSDATAQLVKWDREENRFKKIIIPQFKGKAINSMNDIYLDRKNNLIWYGVKNAGLVCYDINSQTARIYGVRDGLNSDVIFSVTKDEKGKLWLATSQGISTFNPITEHFINYSTQDGLPATYLLAKLLYDEKNDIIYAGAAGTVVYFSPEKFTINRPLLHARITSIKVNNKDLKISNDGEIELSHKENDLTFYFTAINLTDGKDNRYSYNLGGIDAAWKDIGKKRQIRFASLKPGQYRFMVRAAGRGGEWSSFADRVDFTIRPPFVKTIWFYILTLFLISCAIYGWYRYRLSNILRLEKMQSRISHDLHDDIGSRLTNISMMTQLVRQKKQKEEQKIEWLVQIQDESLAISQSIREIVWNINPDNDSLENAMPKLLRYASELLEKKKIVVHASIGDLSRIKMNMEERRDIFLIFKEAIHNIVKHSYATETLISVKKDNNLLLMQIEDNGNGFLMHSLDHKNGLDNMQARADSHNWKLEIKPVNGKGTDIHISIKIT